MSMYTIHNAVINIDSLKVITAKEISAINFNSKTLNKKLSFCNLNKEDLLGKYYDKDGNIIYQAGAEFYMFDIRIKELSKLY
jgi:hypothetical protein